MRRMSPLKGFLLILGLVLTVFGRTLLTAGPMGMPEPRVASASPYLKQELQRWYTFYRFRPRQADICLNIARLLEGQGENGQALGWFEEAYRLDPATSTLELLVERYGWAGKADKALPLLNKLAAAKPGDLTIRRRVAEVSEWAGDQISSARHWVEIWRVTGDRQALVHAGDLLAWSGLHQEAVRLFLQGVRKWPQDVELMDRLADAYEAAKDLNSAVAWLRKAQAHSYRLDRQGKLAERLSWSGDAAGARAALEPIRQRQRLPTNLLLILAEADLALGSDTAALEVLARISPKHLRPDLLLRRAELYAQAGKVAEALLDADRVGGNPRCSVAERFPALLLAGEYLLASGAVELAAKRGQTAHGLLARRGPPLPPEQIARFWLLRARIAVRQEDLAAWEEAVPQVLRIPEPDPWLLYALAGFGLQQQRWGAAERLLRLAHEREPMFADVLRDLSVLLLRQKRVEEAMPLLRRWFALDQYGDPALRARYLALLRSRKAWADLLPICWDEWLAAPFKEQLLALVDPLVGMGQAEKAAELVVQALRDDPYDPDLPPLYKRLTRDLEVHSRAWREETFVAAFQEREIASLSRRLKDHPDDLSSRERRGDFFLWMHEPGKAFDDYDTVRRADPDDPRIVRKVAETSEAIHGTERSLPHWRHLQRLQPDSATATLHLAQRLSWAGRQREAWPFVRQVRNNPCLEPIERDVLAFPAHRAAGQWRRADKLHERLRPHFASMTMDVWRDMFREALAHRHEEAPQVHVRFATRGDTEEIRETTIDTTARWRVVDGRAWHLQLTDRAMRHNTYGNRPFRGLRLDLGHTWHRPDGRHLQVGFKGWRSKDDDRTDLLWPTVEYGWRGIRVDSRLRFSEDLLTDTPEALRRGLRRRVLEFARIRNIDGRSSGEFSGALATQNDAGGFGRASLAYERLVHRFPRRGWRYIYSWEHSWKDGGTVYYSPGTNRSHQVMLFAERFWRHHPRHPRPRRDDESPGPEPRRWAALAPILAETMPPTTAWPQGQIGDFAPHGGRVPEVVPLGASGLMSAVRAWPVHLSGEVFGGKEETRSTFYGARLALTGPLGQNLHWHLGGDILRSTFSQFGTVGDYRNWNTYGEVAWHGW